MSLKKTKVRSQQLYISLHFCRSLTSEKGVSINLSSSNHRFFLNRIFFQWQLLIAAVCHSGTGRRTKAIIWVSELDDSKAAKRCPNWTLQPANFSRDQILDLPIRLTCRWFSMRSVHKACLLLFCPLFSSICHGLWVFCFSALFNTWTIFSSLYFYTEGIDEVL